MMANSVSSLTTRSRTETFAATPPFIFVSPHNARSAISDDFFGLVVGLAVAAQRRGLGTGIKLLEAGCDLGVLAFEQGIAGKIALDQERAEFFHVEHPDRLRKAELLQPVDPGDALDAAAEQRAGAV